jgi:hypothetical protein
VSVVVCEHTDWNVEKDECNSCHVTAKEMLQMVKDLLELYGPFKISEDGTFTAAKETPGSQ